KYEKEDTNFVRIWAIGGYPIECEDYDINITLFVLVDLNARDLETQAVFEKDNYYCIGGKIVPTYYGKIKKQRASIPESNKCPLKISLIGVLKEILKEVKNNENAIIQILITDYVGKEYNFTVKVVFPYLNPRF
ncbi:11469_t:CDS:2, partial [Gigaspora rosea]